MRGIITLLAFFSLVFFFFVPPVFADNVVVTGRVENMGPKTEGSKIIFKDSASKQEVISQNIDPLGAYVVYVPEGTYDITILPPTQSDIKPITKPNQKISSNTESNFALPSSANSLNSLTQNIPMNILYVILGGIIVVILIVIGFVAARRK